MMKTKNQGPLRNSDAALIDEYEDFSRIEKNIETQRGLLKVVRKELISILTEMGEESGINEDSDNSSENKELLKGTAVISFGSKVHFRGKVCRQLTNISSFQRIDENGNFALRAANFNENSKRAFVTLNAQN